MVIVLIVMTLIKNIEDACRRECVLCVMKMETNTILTQKEETTTKWGHKVTFNKDLFIVVKCTEK